MQSQHQPPSPKAELVASPLHCQTDSRLTDAALQAGGMTKVQAYVRAEPNADALRTRRHRESRAEAGLRQVNVVAPVEAHAAIKAIAEHLRAGGDVASALRQALDREAGGAALGSTRAAKRRSLLGAGAAKLAACLLRLRKRFCRCRAIQHSQ